MSTSVRRALYGKLSGDTTLNALLGVASAGYAKSIYHNEAPQSATYPLVVLGKSSGVPTGTFGLASAYETDVWLIKCIDHDTTADKAEAVAARLSVLLNDASLSISGHSLMYLRRQSDIEYPETAEGEMFHHVGALYRVLYE